MLGERSALKPADAVTLDRARPAGSALEVLWVATKRGLTSFGGPIAHLGYFHDEFVVRRIWLTSAPMRTSWRCVSFCQVPTQARSTSRLVCHALDISELAAWTAFTLPSAIALSRASVAAPVD